MRDRHLQVEGYRVCCHPVNKPKQVDGSVAAQEGEEVEEGGEEGLFRDIRIRYHIPQGPQVQLLEDMWHLHNHPHIGCKGGDEVVQIEQISKLAAIHPPHPLISLLPRP